MDFSSWPEGVYEFGRVVGPIFGIGAAMYAGVALLWAGVRWLWRQPYAASLRQRLVDSIERKMFTD